MDISFQHINLPTLLACYTIVMELLNHGYFFLTILLPIELCFQFIDIRDSYLVNALVHTYFLICVCLSID